MEQFVPSLSILAVLLSEQHPKLVLPHPGQFEPFVSLFAILIPLQHPYCELEQPLSSPLLFTGFVTCVVYNFIGSVEILLSMQLLPTGSFLYFVPSSQQPKSG